MAARCSPLFSLLIGVRRHGRRLPSLLRVAAARRRVWPVMLLPRRLPAPCSLLPLLFFSNFLDLPLSILQATELEPSKPIHKTTFIFGQLCPRPEPCQPPPLRRPTAGHRQPAASRPTCSVLPLLILILSQIVKISNIIITQNQFPHL